MLKLLIAAFIVKVLVVVYQIMLFDASITGLWIGTDEFCQDAEIDSMLLYIGERHGLQYSSYLIMACGDQIVCAETVDLLFIGIPGIGTFQGYVKLRNTAIDIIEDNQWFNLDITIGKMTWEKNNKITASLCKDNFSI